MPQAAGTGDKEADSRQQKVKSRKPKGKKQAADRKRCLHGILNSDIQK